MSVKRAPQAPAQPGRDITHYPTEVWVPAPQPSRGRSGFFWLLFFVLFAIALLVGLAGGVFAYVAAKGLILPGVYALGRPLTGLSVEDAAVALQREWSARTVVLENGDATWPVTPEQLGMTLEAAATAEAARDKGRSPAAIGELLGQGASYLNTPPVWRFDPAVAEATLAGLAPQLAVAPVDAGVVIQNGVASASPATEGRELDVAATVAALAANPAAALTDGRLALVTRPVPAAVTDVSAAVDEANRMLATTATLRAYDPVRDETVTWTVDPATWNPWLALHVDPAAADPFTWTLDPASAESYLTRMSNDTLTDGRYLEAGPTIAALSDAIRAGTPSVSARVLHPARQHVVQPGETLSSIGRDYGIPYPWIQQANPSVDSLSAGQTLTIPSPDVMLPLPPVENKRIVVSIAEQNVRVFENGQIKWEWPASTGIDSSPTAPGIFQVQSHEPNAYAGNWDLWMPSFMGIYRPVPASDFMNGFHGFPTRGNSQLLWTGDLGRPVTYGCILLSSENARQLYEWAEDGVVVEVLP